MTPLYSKETAQYVTDKIKKHVVYGAPESERDAVLRLIENGDEVMRLIGNAETACRAYGAKYLAEDLGELIKKIEGEG